MPNPKVQAEIQSKILGYWKSKRIRPEDVLDLDNRTALRAGLIEERLQSIIEKDRSRNIPLFLAIKNGFIYELAQKMLESPEKPIIVGVAGESASGKTTFVDSLVKADAANPLREGLRTFTVINIDDYFLDASEELRAAGSFEALFDSGYSFDTPDAINFDKMFYDIKFLYKGIELRSPKYDFTTCASNPNGEVKKPARVIIVEGLFAMSPIIKNILDASIYVYTHPAIIKNRWFKRAESRGKSPEAARKLFKIVNESAQMHVRPGMSQSDIIVNGQVSAEDVKNTAQEIFQSLQTLFSFR